MPGLSREGGALAGPGGCEATFRSIATGLCFEEVLRRRHAL